MKNGKRGAETMTAGEYAAKKSFCEKVCPYGLNNFCDGTANKSNGGKLRTKPPCPHFRDGVCELKEKP